MFIMQLFVCLFVSNRFDDEERNRSVISQFFIIPVVPMSVRVEFFCVRSDA